MKVSIITYHDEDNYGATLQAYVTYRVVKELGFTPEIINLHMEHKESFVTKIAFGLKRLKFNCFRMKYMPNKTRLYKSVEELRKDPPVSDVYLVGSDQTWNPAISKNYASAYFLDFGGEEQRRISYASSFGIGSFDDSIFIKKEDVRRLLSRFVKLLVREDTGVQICKNEFGLEAIQVVDPVLLFPSYPELTGPIEETNNIIVYKIKNDPEFYRRSVILGKNMDCNVRSIGSMRRLKGIKSSYPETVEKWIANIASAKYVFTDSFHGTILSLLYHRQFVVYVGDPKNVNRITTILRLLGLVDRICTNENTIEEIEIMLNKPINYNEVDVLLQTERHKSLELLREAIG